VRRGDGGWNALLLSMPIRLSPACARHQSTATPRPSPRPTTTTTSPRARAPVEHVVPVVPVPGKEVPEQLAQVGVVGLVVEPQAAAVLEVGHKLHRVAPGGGG